MIEHILVPLSGDNDRAIALLAGGGMSTMMPAVGLAELRANLDRLRGAHVAVSGSPPHDEIGYGLVPFALFAARAATVTTVDLARGEVRISGVRGFLAGALPYGATQVAISTAAIAAQRVAAHVTRLVGARTPAVGDRLRSIVYLRPHVGVPAGVGGAITHTVEVVRALRALGVDVTAFTTDPSLVATAGREPDGVAIWRHVASPRITKAVPASAAFGADTALLRAARRYAVSRDIVYQRHSRFSLAGALLAHSVRKPLFLEYNGSEAFFGAHWQRGPLQNQLATCEDATLAAATRIFVVAEAERAALIGRGIEPARIVVNPNGVDATRFARGGGSEMRARFGLTPDAAVIGFVASFGPWHGAPVLARAFCALLARRPSVRLLLVGDGPELAETREILAGAGALQQTVFAGKLRPLDVPAALDACDVLTSPHVQVPGGREFFGSPTKLFEYMAAARPIVASRLGQIAEVLEDGKTALLVAPGDAAALGSALERVLDSPELGRRLGSAARTAAVEKHSWMENARRVVDAYESLQGSRL